MYLEVYFYDFDKLEEGCCIIALHIVLISIPLLLRMLMFMLMIMLLSPPENKQNVSASVVSLTCHMVAAIFDDFSRQLQENRDTTPKEELYTPQRTS